MGVKVRIHRQPYCFAGDAVEGTVYVDVTKKGNKGSSADTLSLRLFGHATTRATYTVSDKDGGTTTKTATQILELVSHATQLASFGGRVASGSHSFPFSLMLPEGLPSSMEETNGGRKNMCTIGYMLSVRLNRPGFFKFDAKSQANLIVFAKPLAVIPTPIMIGPVTQKVKKGKLLNCGSMSIGFKADQPVVGRFQSIGLTVVTRNNSSSNINAMRVEIKEEVTWYARGIENHTERTIAAGLVSGSQLGDIQRTAEKGGQSDQSQTDISNYTELNLQEMLDSGAGTRFEVVVPAACNMHTTISTGIIEVKHSLSVTLKTPTFTSEPRVGMSLIIQQNAGAPVAAFGSMQLVENTAVGKGDADGAPSSELAP